MSGEPLTAPASLPPTSTSLPAVPVGSPAPNGAPTYWDGPGDGGTSNQRPTPTGDVDRSQAAATATKAMQLFARPDVPEKRWWDQLRPYLTAKAQHDYAYTDPANVPASELTGPAAVLPTDADTLARIQVPTDVGLYLVLLTRSPQSQSWQVDRLLPPEFDVGDHQ